MMSAAAAAVATHPHTRPTNTGENHSSLCKCNPEDAIRTDVNHLCSALPVLLSSSFLQQGRKNEVCVSGNKHERSSVVNY